jgi:hypothetical protein
MVMTDIATINDQRATIALLHRTIADLRDTNTKLLVKINRSAVDALASDAEIENLQYQIDTLEAKFFKKT